MSTLEKRVNLLAVAIPFLATIAAVSCSGTAS
jgi:hypothetical protein